jgi:hypothetical protein
MRRQKLQGPRLISAAFLRLRQMQQSSAPEMSGFSAIRATFGVYFQRFHTLERKAAA